MSERERVTGREREREGEWIRDGLGLRVCELIFDQKHGRRIRAVGP